MTRSSKFTILDLPPTNWCYWCSNNSCVWIQIQTFLQRDCLGMRGSITLIPPNRWSKCTRCVCSYKDCARARTHMHLLSPKKRKKRKKSTSSSTTCRRDIYMTIRSGILGVPPPSPQTESGVSPTTLSQAHNNISLLNSALQRCLGPPPPPPSHAPPPPPPSLFHEHFSQERRVLFHIPKFSRTLMEAN